MADWRQVVQDPEFDTLSSADQREVLKSVGAPAGFIAELMGDPVLSPGKPDTKMGATDWLKLAFGPKAEDLDKAGQWSRERLQERALNAPEEIPEGVPEEMTAGKMGELAGVAAGVPLTAAALVNAPIAFLTSVAASGVGRAAGGKLAKILGSGLSEPEQQELSDIGGDAGGFVAGAAGGSIPALLRRQFPGLADLLRQKGREAYAKTVASTPKKISYVEQQLRGIEDELPVGTAGRVRRVAGEKQEAAGERINEVYRTNPRQVELSRVSDEITDAVRANTRTQAYQARDASGNPMFHPDGRPVMVPARPKDPGFHDELVGRRASVEGSAEDLYQTRGGASTKEALEMRQTTDDMIKQRKADAFDKKGGELRPEVRALRTEREALKNELHRVTGGPEGEGALADRAFAAWSELKKAGEASDKEGILRRWLISHLMPGKAGAIAGAGAVRLTLPRTLSGRTRFALARALDRGDRDAFIALVPTIQRELLGETND